MHGKKIAVTGAGGYIGSALVNALKEYSSNILCVSRKRLPSSANIVTMQADITNFNCWSEIVEQADVIFHLAGNTSLYVAEKSPIESLNSTLLPISHLIRAASESGRKPKVVFASTATAYGLTEELPVPETSESKPVTVYDLHKLFAEQQLALSAEQGILNYVSLRLANVYGPSNSVSSAADRGILNRMTAMALQGKDLTVYGDGNFLRDYVYIDDVVRAFVLAGLKTSEGNCVFNVGSGEGVNIGDAFGMIADRVVSISGTSVRIKNIPWPAGVSQIEFRNYVANTSLIREVLGWVPKISLAEGVNCMIDNLNKGVANG